MPSFVIGGTTVNFVILDEGFSHDLAAEPQQLDCQIALATVADLESLATLITRKWQLRPAINTSVLILQDLRGAGVGTLSAGAAIYSGDTSALLVKLQRHRWNANQVIADATFLNVTGAVVLT